MTNFEKTFAGLPADALGGRIWRDEVRMFCLQMLKLLHQLVELGVTDLGIVEHVVAVFVLANFVP